VKDKIIEPNEPFDRRSIQRVLRHFRNFKYLGTQRLSRLRIVRARHRQMSRPNSIFELGHSLHDVLDEVMKKLKDSDRKLLEGQYINRKTVQAMASEFVTGVRNYDRYRRLALDNFGKLLAQMENEVRQSIDPGSNPTYWRIPLKPYYKLQGRSGLIDKIVNELTSSKASTLALTGIPGSGKTALAVELGHNENIRQHFIDGILWAGVGQEPNVIALLRNWGADLRIHPEELRTLKTKLELATRVRQEIGDQNILLILDDVWDTETVVPFSIVAGKHCSLLMTTRSPSLAHKFPKIRVHSVEVLDPDISMELLLEFLPNTLDKDQEGLVELVKLVGGLPQALVLVGRHLASQSYSNDKQRVTDTIQKLLDYKKLLKLSEIPFELDYYPNLSEDMKISLEAAILLSVKELSEKAKEILQLLSIFPPQPSSFSKEAAIDICQSTSEIMYELEDAGLIEKDTSGRYRFHQIIGYYASSICKVKLPYKRMIEYYIKLWQEHRYDFSLMAQETQNIEAALQAAQKEGLKDLYIKGVSLFYSYMDSRETYEAAAIHAPQAYQYARELCDSPSLAITAIHLGAVEHEHGEIESAQGLFEEALSHARSINDKQLVIKALIGLGISCVNLNDTKQALELLQEALDLARENGLEERFCDISHNLGALQIIMGADSNAEIILLRGLKVARKKGYKLIEAGLLSNLGAAKQSQGDLDQAERYLKESLEINIEIGYKSQVGFMLAQLGACLNEKNDLEQALGYLTRAQPLIELLGSSYQKGTLYRNFAEVTNKLGNYPQAKEFLEKAFFNIRSTKQKFPLVYLLEAAGEIHIHSQNSDAAEEAFSELEHTINENDDKEYMGSVYFGLGRVAGLRGNFIKARELGVMALEIFAELPDSREGKVKEWLDSIPIA